MNLDSSLSRHFMPHQIDWIMAEDPLHERGRQVCALAEKSIRIGWTYADAFKNVRKRLNFRNRDYLFATKDYPSALEYMRQAYKFAELFNLTRAILSHGEESLNLPRLDDRGKPTAYNEEIKAGVIKFQNKSRIIAFSAHPQAMAVYGGDVGLDEFAKHPNAKLLWETAQGRVALGQDIALWSAHDGEDTLFYQFAQQARAGAPPWNLYYRVTMPDALNLGLLDIINRGLRIPLTAEQYLANCRDRAGADEIYQQCYLCNPVPPAASIVEWSAIQRCRADYQIERLHLEHDQILQRFGHFWPGHDCPRDRNLKAFLSTQFPALLKIKSGLRLGFDVAASGQGHLSVIYIDEPIGSGLAVSDRARAGAGELWLRALFTCRTNDWHFLKTVLFWFLHHLHSLRACGDETGLGSQICWEAASRFPWAFKPINFSSKKSELGFLLMNQLASAEKRIPTAHQDIAADLFALRKFYTGKRWIFTEGRNPANPASHCDIAWAAALSSHSHTANHPGPAVTL